MNLTTLIAKVKEAYPAASDDTLITSLVNWAYREACKIWTPIKRSTTAITLVDGTIFYDLPTDCWLVERVLLGGEPLDPASEDWLDAEYPDWRTTGDVPQWYFVLRRETSLTAPGGKIGFAFKPNSTAASKTVELVYGHLPADLSGAQSPVLPVHLHDALWVGAVWRHADVNEDWDKLRVYTPIWNAWKTDLAADARTNHARSHRSGGRYIRPWTGVPQRGRWLG